ncbi:MAG: hypothetical protein OEW33_17035, partial [Nitrospirota bacterium]|nr:hypothetical protein [Nitrospirota bacterium]
ERATKVDRPAIHLFFLSVLHGGQHMELVMWIVVWPLVMLAGIALIPILVVGTWFVVMTAILGLSDGIIWVLDRRWRTSAS